MAPNQSDSLCVSSTKGISLQDLIYGIIGYALKVGRQASFPPVPSRIWHELLYEFTHSPEFQRFDLKKFDEFSWDGSYPKSEELQEVLSWLLAGGLCMSRLNDQRLVVNKDSAKVFLERLDRLERYNAELPTALFLAARFSTGFFE